MATEFVRLLQCRECKTLEVVPDYEGPPEYDFLLEKLAAPHRRGGHLGDLFKVPESEWKLPSRRAEIEQRIWNETGFTGFDSAYYATRDTFREDALGCFQLHNRNPDCSDYHSDQKRLTPGTAAERKAAGLPKFHAVVDRYLCDFCPVHSLVRAKQFRKLGLDK